MRVDSLYQSPLVFVPLYQPRVWGGRHLNSLLGRALPDEQTLYGESWEICDREEAQSMVADGPWAGETLHLLWEKHRRKMFGDDYVNYPAERFPLLLKILDACDDLSIQVHPPANAAHELMGEPKTEMWYVAHAEKDARIYAGLKAGITKDDFEEALALGKVSEFVHQLSPQAGQSLHLPSGRVHAIGKGLLIYEIQQNSDTTYRVFDWNRLGLDGKPRDLHVKESMQCIDFQDFTPNMKDAGEDGCITKCEYFQVGKITMKGNETRRALARQKFSIFAVLSGTVNFGHEREYSKGTFIFLPAGAFSDVMMSSGEAGAELLEINLPTCD